MHVSHGEWIKSQREGFEEKWMKLVLVGGSYSDE